MAEERGAAGPVEALGQAGAALDEAGGPPGPVGSRGGAAAPRERQGPAPAPAQGPSGGGGGGGGPPPTGAGPPTGAAPPDSWIQRTFERVRSAPHLRLALPDAPPVAVVRVERYGPEAGGPSPTAPGPCYRYDVTVADGVYRQKCHLAPELSRLVHTNALRCGSRVKVTQCAYLYPEKQLSGGFLCLEQLQVLGPGAEGGVGPPEGREYRHQPGAPLKGGKKHYLPLWNNEDPCGEVWVAQKPPQDVCVEESKLTSLFHVDMLWKTWVSFPPLLVRIMHKARLRYYGKPETKLDMPYQAYFEVADHSGMTSVVLWNSLCPEWYNSMKIGMVVLLQQYVVKTNYAFKTNPTPGDSNMKRFSSIEINLNARDPASKINIIPENKVKAEWNLPEVKYRFITRSELDNLPNSHSCDIIGLVQYVGRTERSRKREHGEDFWIHRWVHAVDGTSEQPFILELFATSQPDIFEQIHPMTYLVCTQMRVIRNTAENGSCTIYLTTSNESEMFVTGWHKGQPYTKDATVKSFIQWIKTQNEASHMEKASIGGYYPFPPAPDTFLKYCKNIKVESALRTISELEKVIESLHYRERKCIAFQGIISAIRYVSCSNTSQDASGVEPMQFNRRSPLQTSLSESDLVTGGRRKCQQAIEPRPVQRSPSPVQQQCRVTRQGQPKRKIETVESRDPPSAPSGCSYFTRSAGNKIIAPWRFSKNSQRHLTWFNTALCCCLVFHALLHEFLPENSFSSKESQEVMEITQPCRTGNKEIAGVSEGVQAERKCHNPWESALWTAVKDNLTQHLHYSSVFPESFPCKFNYVHKEFLMQRCNLQAARWKPNDYITNGETKNFENACPLEYYEVAILSINQDIAVDVAFLPGCCPEDSQLFRAEDSLNEAVLPHTSGVSCHQEAINKEGCSEMLSDEVVKAAADLEKQHVICILDICSLGEDKVEVFLNKVYKITEVDVANKT
ncbi:RPA-related protein RADX [Elgaria multicarinata webbii]|uniref:RPA-related protein RADX n=1 Tax=Elgaria multicarinata webbii TaxID=159646 RepID=UPI002FCD140A